MSPSGGDTAVLEWTPSRLEVSQSATASLSQDAAASAAPRPHRKRRRALVFLIPFAAYLAVGILLDFVYKSFNGDAVARLANAFYILHSRDPHLAAIGFVWNPLPSLIELPLLAFSGFWHVLASRALAASICSAAEMAGAVYQLNRMLAEWRVLRAPLAILTIAFAVNPMILFYSGNGMSEALYLFTLTLTARHLSRWLTTGSLRSLVYSACALGLAYLARNEAFGAAFLGGLTVAIVTLRRTTGGRRYRLMAAATDVTIFLAPFFIGVIGWATTSFVITGQWFAQFTSVYGTASQIKVIGFAFGTHMAHLVLEAKGTLAYGPLLPLIALAAIGVALRRKDWRLAAPVAVCGGALAFDLFSFYTNSIIWGFRYLIAAEPLAILVTGSLFAGPPEDVRSTVSRRAGRNWTLRPRRESHRQGNAGRRTVLGIAGGLLAFVLVVPALPTTAIAMSNTVVGQGELEELGFIFDNPLSKTDHQNLDRWAVIQRLTNYVNHMRIPNGSIVADTFTACFPNVDLNVNNPRVFVITNDRDFQRVLADPLAFHARYLLVPIPGQESSLNALNRAYPTLYATGAGFAVLVHQFQGVSSCPTERLYRVVKHTGLA